MFTDHSNDQDLSQLWEKVHLGYPADTRTSNLLRWTLTTLRLTSPNLTALPLRSEPVPSTPQNTTPSTLSYHPQLREQSVFLKNRKSNPTLLQPGNRPPSLGLCSSLSPGSSEARFQHHTLCCLHPTVIHLNWPSLGCCLPEDRPKGGSHPYLP